jgi:signal transduction histidine kinase
MPGTRVYLNATRREGMLEISMRNISLYSLNITSEELMERFVRGDRSRHTEGSGLGLSIAKNLVELQKGKMEIVVDGDLFKAILSFPLL